MSGDSAAVQPAAAADTASMTAASSKRGCCRSCARGWCRLNFYLLLFCIQAALLGALLSPIWTPLLLQRAGDASVCLPDDFDADGPEPIAALPAAVLSDFDRDGVVILRQGLSPVWVARMREMVLDSFARPTYWDKLYSTGLAAFFCAQKTVLLPMTSRCGQNMARYSPLASMAEQLLNSTVIRAAEPSEGMVAVGEPSVGSCGHTAYHRDDSYFPIRGAVGQPAAGAGRPKVAVVRFWIALEPIEPSQHEMAFVNGSHRFTDREADQLSATNFAKSAEIDASGVLESRLISWQVKPGDLIAFAGETVHNAASRACDRGRCVRLIIGFAGDHAVFDANVPSPLMPLAAGQTHNAELKGPSFPKVLDRRPGQSHSGPEEWVPLAPGLAEIAGVMRHSARQGMRGFEGSWFTGCTAPFSPWWLGGLTVPELCGPEPLVPEANFWKTVLRVYTRAPLLAGDWLHNVSF